MDSQEKENQSESNVTIAANTGGEKVDSDTMTTINAHFPACEKHHSESSGHKTNDVLVINLSDPVEWPPLTEETKDFIMRNMSPLGNLNNINSANSKRVYASQTRSASKSMFFTKMKNGQTNKREWFRYSESKGKFFCISYKLFSGNLLPNSFSTGFDDWKHGNRFAEHARSQEHRANSTAVITRGNVLGKIDTKLHEQYIKALDFWHQVLRRVVSVIKFLGKRGLAFRGSDKVIGSNQNGNFLGLLELIAEYDPFLKTHFETHANKGKGHVSYLSKNVCNEFIELISQELNNQILATLRASKYYSISVDSTADVTHCDQLTFRLRMIDSDGYPVERFLKFIPQPGHSGNELEIAVLNTPSEFDINIEDCRGQSYDNAANMSGPYRGLQAKIKSHNPLAIYVPCAAHSLNLVGSAAAQCSLKVTAFFMFVQKVYTFLSAATSRWDILKREIQASNNDIKLLPKKLSDTRWSARHDACRALLNSFDAFHSATQKISNDCNEKPDIRAEGKGLSHQFQLLETGILVKFWTDTLASVNRVNKSLQSVCTNLNDVVHYYNSLKNYIEGLRKQFDHYDAEGKKISGSHEYRGQSDRSKRRKLRCDESGANEATFDARGDMGVNTFLFVIDKVVAELSRKSVAYSEIDSRFGFLSKLSLLPVSSIRRQATEIIKIYPDDLEEGLVDECIHVQEFLKESSQDTNFPGELLKIIRNKRLVASYPNLDTLLRIFICILPTNASGKRSFSILKRVKNYLRNSLADERLTPLTSFVANADLLDSIPFENIITKFASVKSLNMLLNVDSFDIKETLDAILNDIPKHATEKTLDEIKLETCIDGVAFKFTINLTKGSPQQFWNKITRPLCQSSMELQRRHKIVLDLIKKKDKELSEYKLSGAQLTRKNIETPPYNEDMFENKLFTCDSKSDDCVNTFQSVMDLYNKFNKDESLLNNVRKRSLRESGDPNSVEPDRELKRKITEASE